MLCKDMQNAPGFSLLSFVKRLPPFAEFLIVIFVCFGNFILVSLWYFPALPAGEPFPALDNLQFVTMTISEIVSLFAVALFLSLRGWSRRDFGFQITWLASLGGVLLAGAMTLASVTVYVLVKNAIGDPEVLEIPEHGYQWHGSLPVLLIFILVNSVFEEVIVVGYVLPFLARRHSVVLAIAASTVIRVLYHLYQGASAVLTVGTFGVLAGLVYWRWRNLWPLIVAHTFANLWSIAS